MPDDRPALPIARYLRPEEQVVPFRDRPELDQLLTWCHADQRVAAQLVTGAGGTGKTRLALRLCHELEDDGWQPLWVPRGREGQVVAAIGEIDTPSVAIVDYAETRHGVAELLAETALMSDGPAIRVVMLARSSGEWWQRLIASSEEQVARMLAPPIGLRSTWGDGGMHEQVFADALTAFAARLSVSRPRVRLELSEPDPVILVLHAAALLAVLNHALGRDDEQARSTDEVLDALLEHEGRYWQKSADARGLDLDVSVQRLVVTASCLVGAASEATAVSLVTRIPDLADSAERCGKVARWLHDLYPDPGRTAAGPQEWIGSLRPDRLAEHFVVTELTRRPDVVPRLLAGLAEDRASRALTVLGRAALSERNGSELIRSALNADPEQLALPALSVAVETNPVLGELLAETLDSHHVAVATLERMANALPHPSLALAAPAAVVFRRLAREARDGNVRAGWLLELSNRLAELGKPEEALATVEEAASVYRRLANSDPDTHLVSLAAALNNQSNRLGKLGRREEALATIEEALSIYRQLADSGSAAHRALLAISLNNKSNRLAELGKREQALTAIEEAIDIYRQLTANDANTVLPELARSLNTQSRALAELGLREPALTVIEESVGAYRQLADARPDAFLPNLAGALNNQAYRLQSMRRHEQALTAIEEALGIYRSLANARPDAFLPDLAGTLNNQATQLASLARWDGALTAVEEAVAVYRPLANARPDAFLPDLASALNNETICMVNVGRRNEALASADEAVRIYRQLADTNPTRFLPELGRALNNQSNCLYDLGRREESEVAIAEAVNIRRRLANSAPDAFQPDLAGSLINHARGLAALGRRDEALRTSEEAVEIYRRLAGRYPEVFFSDLAMSLDTLSHCLADLGRQPEALAAAEEASRIRRNLGL